MSIINVSKDNFTDVVIQSEMPVLIDFYANWCGPCKMLTPIVDEIANEVKTAKVCKINIENEPELAKKFKIKTIPTLAVMKNGKVTKMSVGVKPKSTIIEMLSV